MTCDLTNPIFTNEAKAIEHMELDRWPNGPVCPFCGFDTVHKMGGKTQAGMFLCNNCREKFTVRTGTVFERSHIPLHKWLLATHLMASSKKGVSAHQLHRMLGITYKSAWFMCHRIREAMAPAKHSTPMGGAGKVVEADETYFGRYDEPRTKRTNGAPFIKKGKNANRRAVVTLIERGGSARSFHVPRADKATVMRIVAENIARESRLHTDESNLYKGSDLFFADHETVKHSVKEYARGDVHVNSAEGYFSIFKRGMRGVYQHCGEKHLHRYLAEFDFRYNNRTALGIGDEARAKRLLRGAEGKRLTYHQTH